MQAAALVGLALAAAVATAVLAARAAGVPLPELGVFYDGYLYVEIARSYPLPYSPRGPDYLGHAPGYPALVWAIRRLSLGAVNWGQAALLATWLPAALCAGVFQRLSREVGVVAPWPTLVFALGLPQWIQLGATPHAEPLAMLCVLLGWLSWLRGGPLAAGLWLALATLTRFPAVLLAPVLALCAWLEGRRGVRELLAAALPPAALGLLHLYLLLRIPGFESVWRSHSIYWETQLGWPLGELLAALRYRLWGGNVWLYAQTYALLALAAVASVLGLRSARRLRVLPLSVLAIAGFHASLTTLTAAFTFTRLAIFVWPAALLVLAARAARVPSRLALPAAALWAAVACAVAVERAAFSVERQTHRRLMPIVRQDLERERPLWLVFSTPRRP